MVEGRAEDDFVAVESGVIDYVIRSPVRLLAKNFEHALFGLCTVIGCRD